MGVLRTGVPTHVLLHIVQVKRGKTHHSGAGILLRGAKLKQWRLL